MMKTPLNIPATTARRYSVDFDIATSRKQQIGRLFVLATDG
jgi:hypothetical protein